MKGIFGNLQGVLKLKDNLAIANSEFQRLSKNAHSSVYAYIKELKALPNEQRANYLKYLKSQKIADKSLILKLLKIIEVCEQTFNTIKSVRASLYDINAQIESRLQDNFYKIFIDNKLIYNSKNTVVKLREESLNSIYKQDSYIEHRYFMNLIDSVYKIRQSKYDSGLTKDEYLARREEAYNSALVGCGVVVDF